MKDCFFLGTDKFEQLKYQNEYVLVLTHVRAKVTVCPKVEQQK